MVDHPDAGAVIQGTGGQRKFRWAASGEQLVESVQEMDEIVKGERSPSREFNVDAVSIKQLRARSGLSQAKFARLMRVEVTTLQNWEQGRREPAGPAKALLTAIDRDPEHVLRALA